MDMDEILLCFWLDVHKSTKFQTNPLTDSQYDVTFKAIHTNLNEKDEVLLSHPAEMYSHKSPKICWSH